MISLALSHYISCPKKNQYQHQKWMVKTENANIYLQKDTW